MTQQRLGAGGENRGEASPVLGQIGMPHREHSPVQAMQRPGLHPARNRSVRIAEGACELSNGHHPVLAGSQRRQFASSLPA
jgi:hypothetical protein